MSERARRWRRRRLAKLLKSHGPCCHHCNRPLDGDVTIEHLLPHGDERRDLIANLRLAHAVCNRAAGQPPRQPAPLATLAAVWPLTR